MWPLEKHLTFLCFGFLICDRTIVPIFKIVWGPVEIIWLSFYNTNSSICNISQIWIKLLGFPFSKRVNISLVPHHIKSLWKAFVCWILFRFWIMSSYWVAASQDAVGSTMIGGVQKYMCIHMCMTLYTYTYICMYVKTPTMVTYSFSYLEPVCCSMSSSNFFFLTCLTGFSRGRSGGLVFPSLSEFFAVCCDPYSQRLWHS